MKREQSHERLVCPTCFSLFPRRRRSSEIGPRDLEPPPPRCHLKTAVYLSVSCFWMNRPAEERRGAGGGAPLMQEAIILGDPMRRSTVSRRNCTVKRKSISDTLPRRWFECCGSSAFCLLGKTGSSLRGSLFHIPQEKKIIQRTPPRSLQTRLCKLIKRWQPSCRIDICTIIIILPCM